MSSQGTWQFISVARLRDPWSRAHEVSDDLESFFWVLIYEIARYRSEKTETAESHIRKIFDQHFKADGAGMVKGGNGKLSFFAGVLLSTSFFEVTVETPCGAIIEEMRSLLRDLYLHLEVGDNPVLQSKIKEKRRADPRVDRAREKLQTSDAFLVIMKKHLESEWDIDDDGSLDLTDPQPDPSASRNLRKRKADDSGNGDNWHVRRIGLYPPKSSMRRSAVDGHSTQTSITSSHHNSPFSTSRDMPSSSLISSGSPRSRKDEPPAEQ